MSEPTPLDRHAARKNPRAGRRAAMKWLRRIAIGMLALAGVAALVCNVMPKPVVVETAIARRGPLAVTVEEEGKTRVRDRFAVTAPITGNLERVDLRVGDPIAQGQVVAQIDPPQPALLDPRAREEAVARLAAADARQRTARTAVARSSVARDNATIEANRTRKLASTGAVTASEREKADMAEQLAIADVAAAQQQQQAAAAEAAAIRAILGQRGQSGGGVTVASPAAGRVLRIVRDSAGPIATGAPIIEVGDPHALEVVVDVLSSDAARIAPGMAAVISAWGGEPDLRGTVTRVEPSAFTRVSALGVAEQRVNVIIAIANPPPPLGDGFRVEGRIILWQGEALSIPGNAVFRDRGQWAVYTVASGRAHLVHVELGRRGRVDVEVARGLAPGSQVVMHPGDAIGDGVRVSAGD